MTGKTLWHITKDRNFRPDPDFRPVSRGGWDIARKPTLYATTSPSYWHERSGGGGGPWTRGRKWAAELELLPGHPPVKRENPLLPQTILDPEFVRVKRVIPVEHAMAEETGYLENKETGFDEYVGREYVGRDYVAAIHCANASLPASNERSRELYQGMPHISIPPTKEEVANWILWNDSNAEVDPQDTLDDYLHTLILMTDESNQ